MSSKFWKNIFSLAPITFEKKNAKYCQTRHKVKDWLPLELGKYYNVMNEILKSQYGVACILGRVGGLIT